jgi:putative oxidoreductase
MKDFAMLFLRLTIGGLVAGHGAQKLFGWFGGHGMDGTAQFMESLGLEPGDRWAVAAGVSEFGGGLLTALGLLHPLGPIGIISAMSMATAKAHADKPIWATEGGAELQVTNLVGATTVGMMGPGKVSLDTLLRVRTPFSLIVLAFTSAAIALIIGISDEPLLTVEVEEDDTVDQPGEA